MLNSKGWGDVWKARRLRRVAWQDSQSSLRHAAHPAGLPGIMTTAILIQCCLNALAQGGHITMPFQKTFWTDGFGMLVDKFGVPWMVNVQHQTA
jgi:hypothetical protein